MRKRGIGEQRSVGQLFRLVFAWTLVSVGGSGAIGAIVAVGLGEVDAAWSIGAASMAVLLSGLITAIVAGRDGVVGAVATALAYIGKILLLAGFVALALQYTSADGRTLVIALIASEIVSLITMTAVVMWGEGPGFDIPERGKGEG